MPENTVSVTRPGPYGNPYVVGQPAEDVEGRPIVRDAAHAVALFRARCKVVSINLEPLRGKNLACFCPEDSPCHADVLLELANGDPE